MDELKSRSKSLSYWLRHAPEKGALALDQQGWAEVSAVLSALDAKGLATDRALLTRVVAENDKQRFEFSHDGDRIRARQGHSIEVEGNWQPADPPAVLYHGTVAKFLDAILREGLTRQRRHHVHLSPDMETASRVGERRGKPVILAVEAAAMVAEGAEFAVSANGVWLVEAVPPKFIEVMDT